LKKLNKAMNDFRIFGVSVGNLLTIATLIIACMTIVSRIDAALEAKIAMHNSSAVALHPYLQEEINDLKDAVKTIEQSSDDNAKLIIEEIRRLNSK